MNSGITIRYDEGLRQFVVTLEVPGLQTFEGYGRLISEALQDLSERTEEAGV